MSKVNKTAAEILEEVLAEIKALREYIDSKTTPQVLFLNPPPQPMSFSSVPQPFYQGDFSIPLPTIFCQNNSAEATGATAQEAVPAQESNS